VGLELEQSADAFGPKSRRIMQRPQIKGSHASRRAAF
jgi:hypothetical protein